MNLFEIVSEHFEGAVKVVRPKTFLDNRGSFNLTYLEDEFKELGIPNRFVREMYTRSHRNVLRGLHYQLDPPMGKLMSVISGGAYLVAVDMRPYSPTFLQHHSILASEYDSLMIWAPAGFARGYYSLMNNTVMQYKCDALVGQEIIVQWDDPRIGIKWPNSNPILSKRDAYAQN